MINNYVGENLKETLHKKLEQIGSFEECSLLNYPDYLNIGDHLIWLGTVFYLTDILKVKIKYTAAGSEDLSDEVMEKQVGKAPIILQVEGTWETFGSIIKNFANR